MEKEKIDGKEFNSFFELDIKEDKKETRLSSDMEAGSSDVSFEAKTAE